jgi:hypothetical protein
MTTQMRPEVEFSQRQLLQWPWSSVSSWKGLLVDSWPLGNEVAGAPTCVFSPLPPNRRLASDNYMLATWIGLNGMPS